MPTKERAVKIVPDGDAEPLPAEVIEQAIVDIADGMKRLNNTRLTRKAIVTLLYASCSGRVNKGDIELVLSSLESLEADWLKPKPRGK